MTRSASLLRGCLHRAGTRDVVTVQPAPGGLAALAGIATRRDASSVFVKVFADAPADDVFKLARAPDIAPDGSWAGLKPFSELGTGPLAAGLQ